MQSRSRWIDDIEIESGPHEEAQRIAWLLIANAIDESMLSEGPDKPIKTGTKSISMMTEARKWLMDDTETVPGEYLGGGMVAGASCKSCVSVLPLSMMAVKRILGHLWLLQDEKIWGTMQEQLKTSRVAIRAEARHNKTTKDRYYGRVKHSAKARHDVLLEAGEVLKESRGWH